MTTATEQKDLAASVPRATRRSQPRWRDALRHGSALVGLVALGLLAYHELTHLTGQLGQVCLTVVVWTIALTGLNIVQGLSGYLSLAQASFFGGGAYISSILLEHGWSMWPAAIAAVALVALGGLVVGLVFGRTRGQYFAIGTLFFAAVFTLVLDNEIGLTGGPQGLPVELGFQTDTSLKLLAASMSVGFAIFYFLRRSRLGWRLLSIREDEDLATHLGVPTARTKLVALALSAAFGAWAGVLLAQYNGVISPSEFGYETSFLMFVGIGLAGYGRVLSPLLGSLIVVGVPELLELGPGVSEIAVGVIFVAIMLLMPGGILGGAERGLLWLRGRYRSARGLEGSWRF